MRTPSLLAAALLVPLPALPGCVVGRMHDGLAATRAGVERLASLAPELQRTNDNLERTLDQLARTNANIERIGMEMAQTQRTLAQVPPRLDESVAYLRDSTNHLSHLQPMMASLHNLDESLAALRKVIENVDKAVPGNMTKGTPPADRALERAEQQDKSKPHEPK